MAEKSGMIGKILEGIDMAGNGDTLLEKNGCCRKLLDMMAKGWTWLESPLNV